MIIAQIYADNPLRNFNYVLGCPHSRDALVIDPLDVAACLAAAERHGLTITKIVNTHEHWDHIAGNAEMQAKTGARIYAHAAAPAAIGAVDVPLAAGDQITIGDSGRLQVLDTPGHTMSHLCLLSAGGDLFCGDTLLNAGVGNCHKGGDPDILYDSIHNRIARLPDTVRVYPGHDYILTNLAFSLDREPDNSAAQAMQAQLKDQDPHKAYITTLGEERQINSFFRLDSPSLIAKLMREDSELDANPTPRMIFKTLRRCRDHW